MATACETYRANMEEPTRDPIRVHLVHAGAHVEYVGGIAAIARQERHQRARRRGQPEVSVCVRPAGSRMALAWELTEPANLIVFTGHGSPEGTWLTGSCGVGVEPDEIETVAGRPIATNGLIIDACYAWQLRTVIGRQSERELAYLAPDGVAPYSHTWLVTAVLLALLAPGSTCLGNASSVLSGIQRGVCAARTGWPDGDHDRWHFCLLPAAPGWSS
jgi:hypothetical protein